MWKIKELTDKVTNVVMNYSEVETKVREATNDEAWGPHGAMMQEIAQYTFTYEHFPEVMGMLWKRMLHENKKSWRRVYKSLLLLMYLVKNGSERVVTGAREHLYDLRSLENYTFTDEMGKDQGLNVRHKVKEIIELIQDDDRLRDERKKAKKNKDKYQGMSGESLRWGGGGGGYSDRYDEQPRKRGELDEIDDWQDGKKSVVEDAVDKVKDLWNRAHGRQNPEETVDYSGSRDRRGHDVVGFSEEIDNKRDDDFDFKDSKDDYAYHDHSQATHTERVTSKRRSTEPQKIDLGAAASRLQKDRTDTQSTTSTSSRITSDTGPNLLDIGGTSEPADFADFQSANTNGDFNPRGDSQGSKSEFGDFADFSSANSNTSSQNGGFADFSRLPTSPQKAPTGGGGGASSDLLDVFSSPSPASSVPLNPNMGMPNLMNMQINNTNMVHSGVAPANMMGGFPPNVMMGGQPTMISSQPNLMGGQPTMMTAKPNMMGHQQTMVAGQPNIMGGQHNMMAGQPNMMGMQQPNMSQASMMGGMGMVQPNTSMMGGFGQPMMGGVSMGYHSGMMQTSNASMAKSSNNTWSSDLGKVNISLDALSPASKYQKQQQPSMNQLQQNKGVPQQGMMGLNQGMGNMNLGTQPMMGGPVSMGGMTSPPAGMSMHHNMMMSNPTNTTHMQTANNLAFQKKTDAAFASFGIGH